MQLRCKFSVDVDGNMSCQDATSISGSISVDDGVVGLCISRIWFRFRGFLQNSSVSASIVLNPTTTEITFLTSSANVLETKVRIKPQDEWKFHQLEIYR